MPKNGKRFGSAYSVGQRVRFSCETGFVLQGAAVIECLKNKTWNKAAPTCEGKNDKKTTTETVTVSINIED